MIFLDNINHFTHKTGNDNIIKKLLISQVFKKRLLMHLKIIEITILLCLLLIQFFSSQR